jgi:hypothetical protein
MGRERVKREKGECPRCGQVVTVLIGGTLMAHLPRHGYASIPNYCAGSNGPPTSRPRPAPKEA